MVELPILGLQCTGRRWPVAAALATVVGVMIEVPGQESVFEIAQRLAACLSNKLVADHGIRGVVKSYSASTGSRGDALAFS
jgi:hypothetical protein